MLDEATGEQFKVSIRGEVIQPGEPDYAEARKAYNAMIDKHPRVIVRCADVADVILAVRGGGHGVAGFSLVDDGLVIDLSQMRGVRVDPQGRMVRVEGGATFRETIAAANKEKGI